MSDPEPSPWRRVKDFLIYLVSFLYYKGTITLHVDGSRTYQGMPARELLRLWRGGFGGRHRHRVQVGESSDE